MFRSAKASDIHLVHQLSIKTKENMIGEGLNQWVDNYPPLELFISDYKAKGLYVYLEKAQIIASISILPENDPSYSELTWESENALVIHRLLVDPDQQHKGIGHELLKEAISIGKKLNKNIKVDTHPDNIKMQNLILKMQFKYVGYLKSINRLAYEFKV